MSDETKPTFENDPDRYLGSLSLQLSRTDQYLMGPMAQMTKVEKKNLDVPARLGSRKTIEYNFDLLKKMGTDDAMTQLQGLIMHQALIHMDRKRQITGGLQQYQPHANLAAELATWHKFEHTIGTGRKISDKFPKPSHFGFPEGLSMEEYFKLLVKKDPPKEDGGQPQPKQGQGQQQPGQGQGQAQGQEQTENEATQSLAERNGGKEAKGYHKQDYDTWSGVSTSQQKAMQEEVERRLEPFIKSRGDQAGNLKRLLEDLQASKKEKWFDIVRNVIGNRFSGASNVRRSQKRPSRRLGLPNPGRVTGRKGEVFVAIDTSGSIGDVEMKIFMSKLLGLLKSYEREMTVIIVDCVIHTVKTIRNAKDIKSIELKGGGGTSSRPVFEYIETHPCDMLVYLTDLYIDFPETPPKNLEVIWAVLNNPEGEAPFGRTFHVEVEPEFDVRKQR